MDQIDDPVCQIPGKIRTVIIAAVFAQPPRYVHAGKALAQGEFDIWISFVVAQQDVETRLLLLDKVVFQRQRFFVVVYDNIFNVYRFA